MHCHFTIPVDYYFYFSYRMTYYPKTKFFSEIFTYFNGDYP